jgi:hypothetical protein
MHSASQRLSIRAVVGASPCGGLRTWTRRLTTLMGLVVVALAGGLAVAQDAPPQGPPAPEGAPGAPSTTTTPSRSGATEPPKTPGIQQTINGDAAVWAEVQAVYSKLDALSGYRKKVSGVKNVLYTTKYDQTDEIVPLMKARHTIIETQPANGFSGGMGESVVVGNQSRFRHNETGAEWGPWECVKAAPVQKPGKTGGVSMQETIEASRGPDASIDGKPMRTYVYTTAFTYTFSDPNLKPMTGTVKVTLYVDTETGLLRRSIWGSVESPTTTTDYYDYDAKIDVTLPPCEKEL